MDLYTMQDIAIYLHQSKTAAVIKDYKDRFCMLCTYFVNDHYNQINVTLSSIESNGFDKWDGSDDADESLFSWMVDDIFSVAWHINESYFIIFRDETFEVAVPLPRSYYWINHRHTRAPRKIGIQLTNFNGIKYENQFIPDNYIYTYEKEGWLKKVVNSEKIES